jgi:hypothetical protein
VTAPSSGQVIADEGTWSFGTSALGNGDYNILLNGSAASGGWAASLLMTNGRLYTFSNTEHHYWRRYNAS